MGKRIKWLSDTECDCIKSGTMDYSQFYSADHLENNDSDSIIKPEDLLNEFKLVES
jgi:hypothetical protein